VETSTISEVARMNNTYHAECFDKNGVFKWKESSPNMVVDQGIYYILLAGFVYDERYQWFCGLVESGTPAATDTPQSHPGWVEYNGWVNINRPALEFYIKPEHTARKALTSNVVQFVSGTTTQISGAYMVSEQEKGSTEGTLYGVSNFSSPKEIIPGDAINITIELGATG